MRKAVSRIRAAGAHVPKKPVKLISMDETLEAGGEDIDDLMGMEASRSDQLQQRLIALHRS